MLRWFILFTFVLLSFDARTLAEETLPVSIPEELGRIEFIRRANDSKGPWVIQVQDMHCIVEAQKSIRGIIDYLEKEYGLRYIYLEGGEGKLNISRLRRFSNEEIKRSVLEKYLNRGEISGAEYAAVINEKTGHYFGIENQSLYDTNRRALLRAMRGCEERNHILKELERRTPKENLKALQRIRILFLASSLELTRNDHKLFRKILEAYQGDLDLKKLFAPVVKFYDLALKRDRAMSFNVIKRLREDRAPLALLVTGGFHAEGMSEILGQEGISTLLVTPRFHDWKGKENYLSALQRGLVTQGPALSSRLIPDPPVSPIQPVNPPIKGPLLAEMDPLAPPKAPRD